ncbi:piggyBac transposable element-derived protein 4-like [Plodia interpunctella]|uniref:piggyBac transposable element-derived protein 4-like n=1 Tax=Plodia interpunctella TaxID=58824 RepID=UPI003100D20F
MDPLNPSINLPSSPKPGPSSGINPLEACSSPQFGTSTSLDPLNPYMILPSSPTPGPSSAIDPLEACSSPQFGTLTSLDPLNPYMILPSSPTPGPSSAIDPLEARSSPQFGTPTALDPLTVELGRMMSPQETMPLYDMEGLDFIGDEELYGILTGNNDDTLDELNSADPNEETNISNSYENQQAEEEEDTSPEETTGWYPGNPTNMSNIIFTGTSGMLPPHDVNVKSPLDYFFLFFNSHFINLILECTNKYGNKLKATATTPRARFRKWTDVSVAEFKTFLGLLLLMGTIKLNRLTDYWSTHYLFRLCVRQFMSRDRFFLILRALNVQNNERTQSIFKIKSLIDLFNDTIDSVYYPLRELTIDESLILWKGRLRFRQYITGKAHRYGIKLYILADANGIILKIHVYAGSQDTQVGGKNHIKKVVHLLMKKYIEKGHSLYLDNFYTSVGLSEELLCKNTYVTGTLRANRIGNPTVVKNIKLKPGESCIVHNWKKIVVTKWQDKREILFISSEHTSQYKATTSRRVRTVKYKPAVQIKYNKYMRAIDRHDQMLSYYCCEHKTLRWYKKVIIHIIQICLVNGFLLFNARNKGNETTLYKFRMDIMEKLLPMPNRTELSRSLSEGKIHLPANLPKKNGNTLRKRCRVCYLKTKKRVSVLFGCPDCPGFPGLCIDKCFREFHKY